jgi:hypothetical protein
VYWGIIMFLARSRSPNDDKKILVMLYKYGCFHIRSNLFDFAETPGLLNKIHTLPAEFRIRGI